MGFVGGCEEVEISYGGILFNLSRIVSWRLLSFKFLVSLNSGRDVLIFCFVDSNGYFFYGEDYFDS